MRSAPYSLAALREYRRRKEQGKATAPLTLADIPPEAPMEAGIIIGCWNGRAFVSWEKWLASLPAEALRTSPESAPVQTPPPGASRPRRPRERHEVAASLFGWEEDDGRAG